MSDMETVIGSSWDRRLNLGCRDSTYVLQACAGTPRQARPEGINLVETTGGVETHLTKGSNWMQRAVPEKKKGKEINSVHGRERNSVHGLERNEQLYCTFGELYRS